MFGGLLGSNQSSGTDFGEQMLNTVAAQSIRHLFTKSDVVEVSVRCYPSSKLLQGSIDSFKMSGRGLVIRRQFEVDEMSFETDAVAIDFGSVMGGKLRLKQPTQAVAQITLNEAGINRAFQAELVQKRLQNVDSEELTNLSGGEPVTFRNVEVKLLPDNQVSIAAETDFPNRQNIPIRLLATLAVEKRRRISFSNPKFDAEQVPEDVRGIAGVVSQAFAEVLDNMVDLDRFDLDGVLLRINRLETHGKKLVFSGYAQIDHFPGT
ncbi:LmeA family phospholipid-binding protein [Egbenema bharatensis]|uniref:LmeA family phospholipid-binding protein n=1 Tax=Egbenema bharatensis TaxID=3463334 RepID=UPI003A880EB6